MSNAAISFFERRPRRRKGQLQLREVEMGRDGKVDQLTYVAACDFQKTPRFPQRPSEWSKLPGPRPLRRNIQTRSPTISLHQSQAHSCASGRPTSPFQPPPIFTVSRLSLWVSARKCRSAPAYQRRLNCHTGDDNLVAMGAMYTQDLR